MYLEWNSLTNTLLKISIQGPTCPRRLSSWVSLVDTQLVGGTKHLLQIMIPPKTNEFPDCNTKWHLVLLSWEVKPLFQQYDQMPANTSSYLGDVYLGLKLHFQIPISFFPSPLSGWLSSKRFLIVQGSLFQEETLIPQSALHAML